VLVGQSVAEQGALLVWQPMKKVSHIIAAKIITHLIERSKNSKDLVLRVFRVASGMSVKNCRGGEVLCG
jgi:hypothetical protein